MKKSSLIFFLFVLPIELTVLVFQVGTSLDLTREVGWRWVLCYLSVYCCFVCTVFGITSSDIRSAFQEEFLSCDIYAVASALVNWSNDSAFFQILLIVYLSCWEHFIFAIEGFMDCVSVAGMLLQKSGDRRPLRKHWSVHIMGLLDHIAVFQYGSGEVTRVNRFSNGIVWRSVICERFIGSHLVRDDFDWVFFAIFNAQVIENSWIVLFYAHTRFNLKSEGAGPLKECLSPYEGFFAWGNFEHHRHAWLSKWWTQSVSWQCFHHFFKLWAERRKDRVGSQFRIPIQFSFELSHLFERYLFCSFYFGKSVHLRRTVSRESLLLNLLLTVPGSKSEPVPHPWSYCWSIVNEGCCHEILHAKSG